MKSGHAATPRGLDSVGHSMQNFGRFGRMFPHLPAANFGTVDQARPLNVAIAESMIKEDDGAPIGEKETEDENDDIPAGYTYLGQFIDHDLTFDPVSRLDRLQDPDGLEDFRTPRLDLDSVYGRGPSDQPFLYSGPDYRTFLLGPQRQPSGPLRPDLPRNTDNPARALIGDKRNDENKIVTQLHALFLMFHNAVVAQITDDFDTAQRLVRWHYQWLVLNDFLPRIVGQEMRRAVLDEEGPHLAFFAPDRAPYPFMPVEFAVAAYRFGHSMVRPSYALNSDIGTQEPHRIPIFTDDLTPASTSNMNGFGPIPEGWGIDWGFFFGTVPGEPKDGKVVPQPSYRIDSLLVDPLKRLPEFFGATNPEERSLAFRNLQRSVALGLPSGQAVARAMGLTPLTDEQLWLVPGNLAPEAAKLRSEAFTKFNDVLCDNAPLWYYVLREAELSTARKTPEGTLLGGHHLGPVGGRIVAETLVGLVHCDGQSYLRQHPKFRPHSKIATQPDTFDMKQLVDFVSR
jgi:hypothetical protein